MNEFPINNTKVSLLTGLCRNILKGETDKETIKSALEEAGMITPLEALAVLEQIIVLSDEMQGKKQYIAKTLNILNEGLREFIWEPDEENSFLMNMIAENCEIEKCLEKIKMQLKKESKKGVVKVRDMGDLLDRILELDDLKNHYLKKENILFPIMEKKGGDLGCLPVMWSIHDDVRKCLKELKELRKSKEIDMVSFNRMVGELFFSVYAMIYRENRILFPAAHLILTAREWEQMHKESFDIGFSFIRPEQESSEEDEVGNIANKALVELSTGTLDSEVLELLINTLPLDVTYIDEKNKVKYFSQPRDRIFTRSKAVLGRDVRNCHPPESLEKVDRIIASFRNGASDKESFRIHYRNRYILIEYYPIKKKNGEYKGVLEVTMDITDIHKMEGEKRL